MIPDKVVILECAISYKRKGCRDREGARFYVPALRRGIYNARWMPAAGAPKCAGWAGEKAPGSAHGG